MATVKRPTKVESTDFEVFTLELSDDEKRTLRADPEGYLQMLLGEDHLINGVTIDTRILRDETCPGIWKVVHLRSAENYSWHSLRCIPLP
ncbi:hypothetical protein FHT40_003014 [Mycolicibacterium sp. BK556]|uniref:hypothetical protein n=1 Tax=Mycobacteriaceae TaxID=1762 RepID=UPI00105EF912|nr:MULTISPECIES: hypothetical protein [Mycobacteriaceae]MBB3603353.1 hypothetical protein [Mycolicibacterium sp. BK556]MBB3633548.1 hypothetical protein [Mycolicibacterium sp. BK607]MBB3751130.1 hypothetical protein [Mycolicibacterium sp. BK634]TDO11667.1 hypothetical protein EV580_3385 [Mycobacterium sp. BK086]